eukprot:TRINITY_DN5811_c0_g1_i1.p1 TRINITY_DN5811_c0_g1~~TRINITY_DN5811_c0_g1_i1.p1  ORF type:complete len:416 (-),score=124.58 TRINITY_DN5811_c0_g1_i1:67-1314(-)
MEPGSLEVVIYRGRNLPANKKNEAPCTYCSIQIGKELYGTKHVEKNKSPQWHTVSKFKKVDVNNEKSTLEICVRTYKKDKFMGKVQIPLSSLREKNTVEKWFPLLNKKLQQDPEIQGEIEIKVKYYPLGSEHEKKVQQEQKKQTEETQRDQLFEGRKATAQTLQKPSASKSTPSAARSTNPFDIPSAGAAAGSTGVALGSDLFSQLTVDQQIQAIDEEAERIRQASKDSTTRCLQAINSTQTVAAESSEKLHRQGQQMLRITEDGQRIDTDLDRSKRSIRSIKSIFGATANKFSKGGKKKASVQKSTSETALDSTSDRALGHSTPNGDRLSASQPTSAKDPCPSWSEKSFAPKEKDHVDRDLEEIGMGLQNLKNIALEMGKEIDSQTKTIEKLTDQTYRNEERIGKFNRIIPRLK